MDFEANCLLRRLHFSYNNSQNMVLQSFYRTNENKNDAKQRGFSRGYDISISLKDKRTSKAEFYFRIAPVTTAAWPHYALRLERLDGKRRKVLDVRKFDLIDLPKYEMNRDY